MVRAQVIIRPRPEIDLGRVHDTDYLAFARFPKTNPVILDIGANSGQSITSFKEIFPQSTVHSFEINSLLSQALADTASKFSGVHLYHFGLSDENAELALRIPYVNGLAYEQEASIEPDHFENDHITTARFAKRGGTLDVRRTPVNVRIGDELDMAPDIIKIDVEGAEGRVVEGLQKTIARFRPMLIIENGDHARVTDILEGRLGYKAFRFEVDTDSLIPFSGVGVNTIYIHSDNASLPHE
jgi:FkbM family methyltransferase